MARHSIAMMLALVMPGTSGEARSRMPAVATLASLLSEYAEETGERFSCVPDVERALTGSCVHVTVADRPSNYDERHAVLLSILDARSVVLLPVDGAVSKTWRVLIASRGGRREPIRRGAEALVTRILRLNVLSLRDAHALLINAGACFVVMVESTNAIVITTDADRIAEACALLECLNHGPPEPKADDF